jgi:phytoene dehydrogenase-like protein
MAFDAVIVGSGPNGLSAAIVLAQAGLKVAVFEAEGQIGGGARSAELTLPGFTHDICSAIHPFGVASPFFKGLPLERHGLEWIQPPVCAAHPLDDGSAAIAQRSVEETGRGLGRDAQAYAALMKGVVDNWGRLEPSVLGPLRWPRHPIILAKFGLQAFRSIDGLIDRRFVETRTRALFAGYAAHGMLPLDYNLTAGFALMLGAMCHIAGWPMPRGGSQRITDALAAHLHELGGDIITDHRVTTIDELPPAKLTLLDLSPRPVLRIAGHKFPPAYRRTLEKYRYGMGVFKVDWALDAPIPWTAEDCRRAGTVHVGGTFEEIAQSEKDAWEGRHSEKPFLILSQPTVFDSSRAPAGKHVAWGYCHVPHGSTVDMLERVERQIERFAPGFRERVLARSVMAPRDIEAHNANMVGGDIGAGVSDVRQFFARPSWRAYATPAKGIYICSASTPPGVGVHGMCGYHAAKLALKQLSGLAN